MLPGRGVNKEGETAQNTLWNCKKHMQKKQVHSGWDSCFSLKLPTFRAAGLNLPLIQWECQQALTGPAGVPEAVLGLLPKALHSTSSAQLQFKSPSVTAVLFYHWSCTQYTSTILKPIIFSVAIKMPLCNTLRLGALLFTADGETKYALKWFKLEKKSSLATTPFIFSG